MASNKKRTHKVLKHPVGAPDDILELPFGVMARFGRFVHMKGTLSGEAHAEAQDALIESAGEILRRQRERRARIVEILTEVDPVDLLGRACLTYLHIDPDTFKEWDSDRSPAHVEYLALQALSVGLDRTDRADPARAMNLTMEAVHLSREMFSEASMLHVIDAVAAHRKNPDDPSIEYILETRIESLAVRGASYDEHLDRVLHGCLDPFDAECRQLIGFTVTEALALAKAMPAVLSDRVAPRWEKAAAGREQLIAALKRDRRRRRSDQFPEWLLKLSPTKSKAHIGMMAASHLFADSRTLCTVTADDLADACGSDPATALAFLDAFACPPSEFDPRHHAYPCGAHPLTERPLLKCDDGYVLPVFTSLRPAIRARMEDLLRDNNKVWDRYVAARGEYVENTAAELLASALPGSQLWRGMNWKSTDDGSDLDGLVGTDDVSLRLQCKAGRLSAPARRGAPERMRRNIGDLIEHAARQHQSLRCALEAERAAAIGFSAEQERVLDARYQFDVIVCLDDVTVWATEAHQLRTLGVLPEQGPVPWVLSLTDLMAVVDLLAGAQLVHYLMRRQRLERDGRVQAHDELDWVGHYITEGLYFDPYFEGDHPPDVFRLLSYTEPIDAWYFTRAGVRTVPAPKPEQPIPVRLAAMLKRLETERPKHWMSASLVLLDHDDAGRKDWDEFIGHARDRVQESGWSNASVLVDGSLGVTVYIDMRRPAHLLRRHVAEYCMSKAEALGQPNWIAIAEAATGGLFVELLEREPGRRLAAVFQEPQRAMPSTPVDEKNV